MQDKTLDDKYSSRHIDLDQLGYYIIWVDKDAREIVADFYTNIINKDGIACDPETGKPIPCSGSKRIPTSTYRARTAKEMQVGNVHRSDTVSMLRGVSSRSWTHRGRLASQIKLVEKEEKTRVTCIDHAMYLGREFAR